MTRPTMTRTEQVLKAVRKGGRIEPTGAGSLLRLVDRKGVELPAWQTALKTVQKKHAEG
ncbi:MAG TPA: hypothetical protein VGE22_12640 [Solimonas sp.]